MERRAFGAWAAAVSLGQGVPSLVRAAAPARIAWISGSRRDTRFSFFDALRVGLQELGRVESRDYEIEGHWGDDVREHFDLLVADMLKTRPDLIVTQGPILFNVQRSRTPLPVLFAFSGDPVEGGFVDSFARPGRNLTGISMLALDLVGKRMEALTELVPGLRQVAVITNPGHAGEQRELSASQGAASKLGLQVHYLPIRSDSELEDSLSTALRLRSDAIMVFPDAGMMQRSERFAAFAFQNRMPAASGWDEFARRGNLLSYGPNVRQVYRRLASYVDKVLRGAKPAELPVELPTIIEHVVNVRSARAMGLTLSRAALLRVDELIE